MLMNPEAVTLSQGMRVTDVPLFQLSSKEGSWTLRLRELEVTGVREHYIHCFCQRAGEFYS